MLKKLSFFLLIIAAVGCSADRNDAIVAPSSDATYQSRSEMELDAFTSDMISQVNDLRAKGCNCGGDDMPAVAPLNWNGQLSVAADRHATDMSNTGVFSHEGSDNSKVGDRTIDAGYYWMSVAENIALMDTENVEKVIEGLKESPTHCRNMMSADFKDMGIAQRGSYWVQVFGRIIAN